MDTINYTLLAPTCLPKYNRTKNVTRFVLATVIAVGSVTNSVEANVVQDNHLIHINATKNSNPSNSKNDKVLTFSEHYSEKEKMLNKLSNYFLSLSKNGWDGYCAVPIERASYLNARKVVMGTPDDILKLWNIFPSPNGTISFEFKDKQIAAMSIGNEDFSYVAIGNSGKTLMDEHTFNENIAIDALIAISKLFGYSDRYGKKVI